MIKNLTLKNFMAFTDTSINFSPKINVIIGENGTGKTHLLKAAYGLCSSASLLKDKQVSMDDHFEATLTAKLLRIFMPLDNKLGKMHHQGASEQAYLHATFPQEQKIAATFYNNSKALVVLGSTNCEAYEDDPVFIPTKEGLSFMEGFASLYKKYALSFDQTYQDICLLLDLPKMRPENLHKRSKWAMEEISDICGGHFVFHGGGRVTFKTRTNEYSANAMAEGFRKLGILSRLLETGAIQPGKGGSLFWDEPETNLNPKLMKTLVRILLELSRNGQQIILATHNYAFLKWLDLLMKKDGSDAVCFHSLYRDAKTSEITLASTYDYLCIDPNPIDEAYGDIIEEEISNGMGGLGK